MAEPNKVKVVIDEEVYVLTSHESVEHIHEVAHYIDGKIREIYAVKSEASINTRLKTLFISLNIADDLFKEKRANQKKSQEIEALKLKIDEYTQLISNFEKENKLLKNNIQDLEKDVEDAKKELEEYIEVFEMNDTVKSGKVTKMR